MKTNKMTKLGVSLLSVVALGVAAPTVAPNFGFDNQVVYAEENAPINYLVNYYNENPTGDSDTSLAPTKKGVLNPGETVNVGLEIPGYKRLYTDTIGETLSYSDTNKLAVYTFDNVDYYTRTFWYEKLPEEQPTVPPVQPSEEPKEEPTTPPVAPTEDPNKPSEQPKPEEKPQEQPKPEVKPETKPSETPKPEVKPTEQPKPEVKPSETPAPKPADKPSSQNGSTSTTVPSTNIKPEVKTPEAKVETKPEAKTPAPKAETKPTAKPATNNVAKKAEGTVNTAALPNTGESNSVFAVLFGFVALALGLFGFRKKSE